MPYGGVQGVQNRVTIQFIVLQERARKARVVSQYTDVYCDCGGKARLDCIAIQCPAKPRYSQETCRAQAGARRRWGVGAGVRGKAGCAGGRRTLGVGGRAGRWARARAGRAGVGAAGRWGRVLGERAQARTAGERQQVQARGVRGTRGSKRGRRAAASAVGAR